MERNQFTFYRSFWDACKLLPKRDQLPFLLAVCAYAFGEEERPLTGAAAAAFLLVRPILAAADRKAAGGRVGGSRRSEDKPEGTEETGRSGEASGKDGGSKKESETEGEKEKEDECPPCVPRPGDWGFGETLTGAVEDWLRYKRERRQGYRPTGQAALLRQVRDQAQRHGEEAVAEILRRSMASGWAGVAWDKLDGLEKAPSKEGDVAWIRDYL